MSERPVLPLLRDPAGLDEDLRRALDAASAHEPSPEALAKLGAKLSAVLPPGTLPPTPTPTGAPPSPPPVTGGATAVGLKWIAAVGVGAAIASGAWMGSQEKAATPVVSTPTAPRVVPTASPPSASVLPPPEITVTTAPSLPEPATDTSVPAAPSTRSDRSPPSLAPALPEATLLSRAHEQLLRGDAEAAIASAAEHARAYPRGSFAQEREVIAIEALTALGRQAEAERRAAAFHTNYPRSSHGERVDRLLSNAR